MGTSTKAISARIRSVKNTKKITKAMEMVAASKVRRLVTNTLEARNYANYSWDLLSTVLNTIENNPLTHSTNNEKTLLLIVSSNKGLCGGYNAQVIRQAIQTLREEKDCDVITVGRKGDTAMRRLNANVVASFNIGEKIETQEVFPIAAMLTQEFLNQKYGKVLIIYTDYISALVQNVRVRRIFPMKTPRDFREDKKVGVKFLFEPNINKVLEVIVQKIINTRIYTMILESQASEESSRMVAMKNASDAASEMADDLTLQLNKVRQAGITQEISEISAGMASIK